MPICILPLPSRPRGQESRCQQLKLPSHPNVLFTFSHVWHALMIFFWKIYFSVCTWKKRENWCIHTYRGAITCIVSKGNKAHCWNRKEVMAAAVNCCNAASWYVLWKTLEKIWYIIYYVGLYFISNLYNVHYTNAVRKPSDHTHTTFSYSVTACA